MEEIALALKAESEHQRFTKTIYTKKQDKSLNNLQ